MTKVLPDDLQNSSLETKHHDREDIFTKSALFDYIAGSFGGAAGTLVGHPFDTVKVRLQTQVALKQRYNGAINCAFNIIHTEGVRGLFKGVTAPLLGSAAMNAIIFGVHGNTMRHMQPGLRSEAIAGSLAGACQTIIICPAELVKTKLQMQGKGRKLTQDQRLYKNSLDCLVKVYRQDGIRGCYRGMVSTMIRDIPGYGSYFWLYNVFCRMFTRKDQLVSDLGSLQLFMAGGLAGMVSWGAFYPCDVIKSRIQAHGIAPTGKYQSNMQCLRTSIQQDGYRVLSRGISVCILRAFPVNAVTFLTVETILRIIENENE